MESTTPLIFYRDGVECGRRELTRTEGMALHASRQPDLGVEADAKLLADYNEGRPADQQANGFAFGGLNVHQMRS